MSYKENKGPETQRLFRIAPRMEPQCHLWGRSAARKEEKQLSYAIMIMTSYIMGCNANVNCFFFSFSLRWLAAEMEQPALDPINSHILQSGHILPGKTAHHHVEKRSLLDNRSRGHIITLMHSMASSKRPQHPQGMDSLFGHPLGPRDGHCLCKSKRAALQN